MKAVIAKRLPAYEAAIAEALFTEASTPMWDLLDEVQRVELVETIAQAGKAAKPAPVTVWTPSGQGLTHVLVLMPEQPFLSDTVLFAAQRANATVVTMATLPLAGKLAPVYLAVEAQDAAGAQRLQVAVTESTQLAQAAVADFTAMGAMARKLKDQRVQQAKGKDDEQLAFLNWLLHENFVFLGYRRYELGGEGNSLTVKADTKSGLGILRSGFTASKVSEPTALDTVRGSLTSYLQEARQGNWLQLSKTPDKSKVHRSAAMDYVGIAEYDVKGRLVAEHRFLGLYTSKAYTSGVRDIPLVRQKVAEVIEASPWPHGSDMWRKLVNVVETFPRDELFLTPTDELLRLSLAMVKARSHTGDATLLARISPREQAVTVFILAPLARYNSVLREKMRAYLHQQLGGTDSDFSLLAMADGGLTRILFKVRMAQLPKRVDEAALCEGVREIVRGWDDHVHVALRERLGAGPGQRLWQKYRSSVATVAYQDATPVSLAADDLIHLNTLLSHPTPALQVRLCPQDAGVSLRIFSREGQLSLGRMMPVVESFGLPAVSEQSFKLLTPSGDIWLHVLSCTLKGAPPTAERLDEAALGITAAMTGQGIADTLNTLVLSAGLDLRAVRVLRALTAYLQQVDRRFDPGFVRRTLRDQPRLARLLWELFEVRHSPAIGSAKRAKQEPALLEALEKEIGQLPSSETDRIGRALREVVLATLRCNAWQQASAEGALALKLDSGKIDSLPLPRPWREIFVFHKDVEGIHLRGGAVARGGLRHSDRATDYRTEVLGLMTAQMRKNTIIVPVGSKGGFYVKASLPSDRAAANAVVRECYRTYIRALLSVTDTRLGSAVLPPVEVNRLDNDDPYLVVAADKGTATFSDLANQTAIEASFWEHGGKAHTGFWLGDAFASGGSQGYDHKAMGITAKGAWVSVQHHLATLGITPSAKRPLVIAGVGDMGGDVFGNGLLLEPHAHLVAAFNHKHIFIDPTPDAASSFAERKRMFKGVLGWEEYDTKKISAGGGVYLRSAKTITLSKQAQALLGLSEATHTPEAIIRAILKAPVDVLWNGGIGTYIKASHETHAMVSDRSNDDLRVNGIEVRAKVIGEGGNLGITAAGRVELALNGVRLNTDALDNSAGVSTSDHEVNLKILFQLAKDRKKMTEAGRLQWLPKLTDDVETLVLEDNYLQNMAVSLEERGGTSEKIDLLAWQHELVRRGLADTQVDTLPDMETLAVRSTGVGYVRPELCALLAATKAAIRAQVDASGILSAAAVRPLLTRYFPQQLQPEFGKLIQEHPLANEIISTALANMLANRCGLLMGQRLQHDFACTPRDSIQAILVAVELLDVMPVWDELDASATLPLSARVEAFLATRAAVASLAGWVLAQGLPVDMNAVQQRYTLAFKVMRSKLAGLLPDKAKAELEQRTATLKAQGLAADLANRLALLPELAVAPDAALVAERSKRTLEVVLKPMLALGEELELGAVQRHIRTMVPADRWMRQAVQAMVQELTRRQGRLAEVVLDNKQTSATWLRDRTEALVRYRDLLTELLAQPPRVEMLSVLLSRLRDLEV